jgi:TolA-binding protein
MKTNLQSALISFTAVALCSGCTLTHEPIRYRDEYFHPVAVPPERGAVVVSPKDVELLKNQLQQANRTITQLLDSLKSMQRYTGQLLTSTRTLVDRVSELESKENFAVHKQKELEQSVVGLKAENQDISKQLNDLRKKLFAGTVNAEPQVFSQAGNTYSFLHEYEEGVKLFHQNKYDDALTIFDGLLEKGIDGSLVDNCEYWIGECKFGRRDFRAAIIHFQKVLAMDSANKKMDAYFMLGKSYEKVGDKARARWAYEELSLLYPNNIHARYVKARLQSINRAISVPAPGKRKKSSV